MAKKKKNMSFVSTIYINCSCSSIEEYSNCKGLINNGKCLDNRVCDFKNIYNHCENKTLHKEALDEYRKGM
jgi:hypothetical protein